MKQLINHPDKRDQRRTLRNNLTTAEAVLWRGLKNKQLKGRRFKRQVSFGAYIVDFYCPSEKLVIELDGRGHFTSEGYEYDLQRNKYLKSMGLKILRFENKDVFEASTAVLEKIQEVFR